MKIKPIIKQFDLRLLVLRTLEALGLQNTLTFNVVPLNSWEDQTM